MGASGRQVGLTKDVGWEVGASRSFPVAAEEAWAVLTSAEGVAAWLGEVPGGLPERAGEPYRTADGATGEVRSFRPGDRVRVTYQPPGRPGPTTVQVAITSRTTAAGPSTKVGFHQEHLADADERAARKAHWAAVLDALGRLLTPS
jgi:uncharacterized protein YndB with AHSA1/START domain